MNPGLLQLLFFDLALTNARVFAKNDPAFLSGDAQPRRVFFRLRKVIVVNLNDITARSKRVGDVIRAERSIDEEDARFRQRPLADTRSGSRLR